MNKLGHILHISDMTGNFILKSAGCEPIIGVKVFDGNLRRVGEIFDVFGPVASPYVAVKPSVADKSTVNRTLFLLEEKRRKKRR